MKQKETSTQAAMNRFIETDLTTPIVDGVLAIRKKVDTNFLTTYFNAASVSLLLINTGLSSGVHPALIAIKPFQRLAHADDASHNPQWISASRVSR